MTIKMILGLSTCFLFGFVSCKGQTQETLPKSQTNNQIGFALVELFTSQGCSSCPSADRLAGKLINLYQQSDKPLILLSLHVDYWNRLGWKDPYSNALFSERQRQYRDWMNLDGVYTPQAVVNGVWETVGSDESKLNALVEKGLGQTNSDRLILREVTHNADFTSNIYYHFEGKSSVLHFAIVQHQAITKIGAGENKGANLSSFNVVRLWKSVNSPQTGDQVIRLDVPKDYQKAGFSIIGLAQDGDAGKINAAFQGDL